MSLKTERAVNEAVTKLHTSKWNKMKKWGRKALLATVSAVSIASGMLGTSQQMHAQSPQSYVTVNANDLDAYLKGGQQQTKQQQYAQVYANRDAYRQQQAQAAAYGSDRWLEENGYQYDHMLSHNVDRNRYLGAFIDWNSTDRYGMPTSVVYLPIDPTDGAIKTSMDNAKKMCEHPGGDTQGIYINPHGVDINNPENNPSWRGHGGGYYNPNASTAEKVVRTVDAAARTAHTIYHMVKGHRR